MTESSISIIDRGMRCLSENLGAAETEEFIATLLRERFDYTEWRKRLVDSVDSFEKLDAMLDSSNEVAKFSGKAKVVL